MRLSFSLSFRSCSLATQLHCGSEVGCAIVSHCSAISSMTCTPDRGATSSPDGCAAMLRPQHLCLGTLRRPSLCWPASLVLMHCWLVSLVQLQRLPHLCRSPEASCNLCSLSKRCLHNITNESSQKPTLPPGHHAHTRQVRLMVSTDLQAWPPAKQHIVCSLSPLSTSLKRYAASHCLCPPELL